MEKYLLSVIIPTKNRERYCFQAVQQVLAATSSQTEIVVQDNGKETQLKSWIEELHSDRVVYHHEQRELSFVDNFSEAVDLANGEYMCMIGDDDGVLPNIEPLVQYMKAKDLDALIPGLNAVYFWPMDNPVIGGGENGALILSYINESYKAVDCHQGLKELLDNGGQDYQSFSVPRLYHGVVSAKILQKIKQSVGTYFAGLTPDMYMAVALSLTCNNIERIEFPVTISGICPASGSAASATGRHTGELKDAPHFRGHDNYVWNQKVPHIYTVETIWADTAMHALDDFGAKQESEDFNVLSLNAQLYKKYPQFRTRILQHSSDIGLKPCMVVLLSYRQYYSKMFNKVLRRILRRKGDVHKLMNVPDIQSAEQETMKLLNRRKTGERYNEYIK